MESTRQTSNDVTRVCYSFPGFFLKYTVKTGEVFTRYNDGTWSGCAPGPDDTFHGNKLGIIAGQHRLLHELTHHIVGLVMPEDGIVGCPIIWRDAHHQPQVYPDADTREWWITSLSYHAMQKVYKPDMFGALMDFAKADLDPYKLGIGIKALLGFTSAIGINVTFENLQ